MDLKSLVKEVYGQAGYTVESPNPDDESDEDCSCCTDATEENTQTFEPYEEERKCAHKDCDNRWTEMVTEEIPVLICGGHAKVCPGCKSQGFSVFNGIGDGRYYLAQNDKPIDNYDLYTAYGLTPTEEDREIF